MEDKSRGVRGVLDPDLSWEMCGCGRVIPANEVCVCPLGDLVLEEHDRRYGIDRTPKPCDVCGLELVEPLERWTDGFLSGHKECVDARR